VANSGYTTGWVNNEEITKNFPEKKTKTSKYGIIHKSDGYENIKDDI
jgi:hypothetical protein